MTVYFTRHKHLLHQKYINNTDVPTGEFRHIQRPAALGPNQGACYEMDNLEVGFPCHSDHDVGDATEDRRQLYVRR